MMNKIELRKQYQEIRKSIKNRDEKSRQIALKILNNSKIKNAKIVGIYMSFSNEVDTKEIIKSLWKSNIKVCVPRVNNSLTMDFYYINNFGESILSKYGAIEPDPSKHKLTSPNDIDVMICPGLCFDKENNRLGYGKGFYDRYLKGLNCYKIGICFKEQFLEDNVITINENDIKMDEVITD